MALGPFGRGKNGEMGTEGAPVASSTPGGSMSRPSEGSGAGLSAFIDQGSEFEGKLSFKDTVRIDGRFLGEITSENTLVVGESGEIMAQIKSQTVMVSGQVTGNIHATRKLVLHKTARVEGDVETPCLVMEDGAWLHGKVVMTGGRRDAKAPKAVEGSAG
jgi:cytoskeletal protein CcmA (bactofilin family)